MDNLNREYDIFDHNQVDEFTEAGQAFMQKWAQIDAQKLAHCGNCIDKHPTTVTLPKRAFNVLFQINATHYN